MTAPLASEPTTTDLASWALGALARPLDAPIVPPPDHQRIAHLADVLNIGEPGRWLVSLLHGLWSGAGSHVPVSAAQAARAAGGAPPHIRSRLVAWGIVTENVVSPGAPLALVLDESIGDWLEGGDPVPPKWSDHVTTCAAPDPMPSWPLDDTADFALNALESETAGPVAITIEGPEGSGRRSFAAAVAAELSTQPIFADLRGLAPGDARALIRITDRAALLTLRPPAYIGGGDVHLPEGYAGSSLWFEIIEPHTTAPTRATDIRRHVKLGALPKEDRVTAWSRLLPGFTNWLETDRTKLAALKPATIGEIAKVAAEAPANLTDTLAALAATQRLRLAASIRPHTSRLTWDDLILPDTLTTALHRFRAEAEMAPDLWSDTEFDRLYPQGRGVFALFSGDPGTGKTMAAQVIARDLGVDLYVVDSGSVVSKYVGETAQNLQSVLADAERDAAVLFFDEADGLFGKRTQTNDAHARYLNADTNVLLQAVESYRGTCILATNRRDNIDPAFARRLRHICDFPRPDAPARNRLFERLSKGLSPDTAGDLAPTCGMLADAFELTGAQIKNAMRTATIEARRNRRQNMLTDDLVSGVEHELQKEGRALTSAEAARLRKAAPNG